MTVAVRRFASDIDRPFFTVMTVGLAAVFAAGFGPTYARGVLSAEGLPWWVHLHGAVMAGWVVLLVVQSALIRSGQRALHQRLGLMSIALIAIMVPLGSATNMMSIRRGAVPPFFTPAELFAVDQLDLLLFAGMFGWALAMRRNPAWHKRLLLSATTLLTYPAVARLGIVRHFGVDMVVPISVSLVLAVALLGPLHDLARYRRVHPGFVWGAAIVFLAQPAHALLAASPPVKAIVAAIIAPGS